MHRRRGLLSVQANAEGASLVWRSEDGLAAIILGDAHNALAVVEGAVLEGLDVTHIVCVADQKTAQGFQELLQRSSSGELENAGPSRSEPVDAEPVAEEAARSTPSRPSPPANLDWKAFRLSDRMQPDAVIDMEVELQDALAAIQSAVDTTDGRSRSVLVHCDMGYNRSPALALAFLVRSGLSLREAYRQVLRVRPNVDPLPPWRRALRALEVRKHGVVSVLEDEPFNMHVSELVEYVCLEDGRHGPWRSISTLTAKSGSGGSDQSSAEDSDDLENHADCAGAYLARAIKIRSGAIEALLQEKKGEEPQVEARILLRRSKSDPEVPKRRGSKKKAEAAEDD